MVGITPGTFQGSSSVVSFLAGSSAEYSSTIAERFGAPDAVLAPINGARLTFPHRRPASTLAGAMDPEQAALAAQILRGDRLVPIHYGGYALSGIYEPVPDALARVNSAAERVSVIQPGDSIEV